MPESPRPFISDVGHAFSQSEDANIVSQAPQFVVIPPHRMQKAQSIEEVKDLHGVTDLQQEHTMLWNAVDAVI